MNLNVRRSLASGLFVMGAFFSSSAFSEFSFSTDMANATVGMGDTYSFSSAAIESCSPELFVSCLTNSEPHWKFSVFSSTSALQFFAEADGNGPLDWEFTTAAPDTYTLQLAVEASQFNEVEFCENDDCSFTESLPFPYSGSFTSTLNVVDLDEVSPVPEPETYAMLLAGLGLLGFAARRRKLKGAVAA